MHRYHLPFGFVETIGTIAKYPDVSIFSCRMSSRILFVQSSPTQFRHVARVTAKKEVVQDDFFHCFTLLQLFHTQLEFTLHAIFKTLTSLFQKKRNTKQVVILPAMLPILALDRRRLILGNRFSSSTQLL